MDKSPNTSHTTNLPAAVVASQGDAKLPQNFSVVAPEERRTVALIDMLIDANQGVSPGSLALYAVMDFASERVGPRLAVVDALTVGHPVMGLCFLNDNGTYDRFSGGRPLPYNDKDFVRINKQSRGEVIVRVGEIVIDSAAALQTPARNQIS